ncbi:hypothetical protein EYZ11_002851 [Aspergillus tanneri]|uniref:GrpB domain protein n=1 Tax=Aspergillus tanneri TaxID=1220188 RepID=A0A4S3JRX0_9EURO|nr:uncharacterized protein ATNIH1004_008474 [Aspergillus tanneri]KAA8644275.1 hypothetical protein ATNIH1004_008474 [Aspergillus tanneri]THC97688.1 hypothetical protein EYZ11_002851 [Aspergillus tanneri]
MPLNPITQQPVVDPQKVEHISTRPQKRIEIVEPSPTWPATYEHIAQRIRSAIGNYMISIEHIGSTSVPGLPAKDIIDVDVIVPDPSAEDSYIPALEAAGFQFLLREPDWYQHRFLGLEFPYANVHVFGPDGHEAIRHRLFRDWLRDHEEDRIRYAAAKREAAEASRNAGETVMQYTDRKEPVIRDILQKIYKVHGML